MARHNDEQLDELIRSKLRVLNKPKYFVEPSVDFSHKLMSKIKLLERRKRWAAYFIAVMLSLVPLAARQAWMLVRGDYFSASSLPMGKLIVGAYQFFLSPAALYVLLALGILAFLLRANKLRRNFNYDFIKMA